MRMNGNRRNEDRRQCKHFILPSLFHGLVCLYREVGLDFTLAFLNIQLRKKLQLIRSAGFCRQTEHIQNSEIAIAEKHEQTSSESPGPYQSSLPITSSGLQTCGEINEGADQNCQRHRSMSLKLFITTNSSDFSEK